MCINSKCKVVFVYQLGITQIFFDFAYFENSDSLFDDADNSVQSASFLVNNHIRDACDLTICKYFHFFCVELFLSQVIHLYREYLNDIQSSNNHPGNASK